MKLEKNAYEDDLPIDISILNIEKYPPHYHKDVEILFVLEGEIDFNNGPFNYLLKAGDIFTNNKCEVHSLHSTGADNKVATIKISSQFFTRFFPKLSKSTYMFYSDKDKVPQQENLKYMILTLIDKYLKQSFNYKQQCIEGTLQIIEYLNENFNVFGFGNNQLRKFENTNPIIIERLHNIIHYTYANHTSNITLEDLAEMEHLSTYYLSHLIKDSIGISYVQFLYFVRVEWSEVNLLNPNKKISTIAREVGFSSTAYYKKYFQQWFGCSPEDYRAKYAPQIKSDSNPEVVKIIDTADAIETIESQLNSTDAYGSSQRFAKNNHLDINVSQYMPTIMRIQHHTRILITIEDYDIMQQRMFHYLREQKCKDVIVLCGKEDNPIEVMAIRDALSSNGHRVTLCNHYDYEAKASGFDSIAAMFYLFNHHMLSDEDEITVPLRDQGDPFIPLKGQISLLTSNEIPKPAYYAYMALSMMKGELLSCGKYYSIIKLQGRILTYMVLIYNYDDSIEKLCQTQSTLYEVKSTIDDFKDELEMTATIELPKGKYFVVKYTMDDYNNVFNFMSKLNFPKNLHLANEIPMQFCTTPQTDVFTTEVEDCLELKSFFIGVGVQMLIIQKI